LWNEIVTLLLHRANKTIALSVMKLITANFEILDNTGAKYASSVTISNPSTSNIMGEIKKKIVQVYNVTMEQILSIGGIDVI